jgi:SAM-dependent methyltransferase
MTRAMADTMRGLLAGALLVGACAKSPAQAQDTSGYPLPDRPVARIVAPSWTAEDSRDDAGEFARVAELLGLRAGQRVADIGAGSGYYVARLAPLLGPTGRVYATDVVPRYLAALRERVRRERMDNVTVIDATASDAALPRASVDVALMIHMYHEIEQPYAVLATLVPAMAAGGRLGILDMEFGTAQHGTPPPLLRCELAAAGWRFEALHETGPSEYVAVFSPPPAAPTPAQVRARLAARPCRA